MVHWEGVKHIFWYLAGMMDWVLVYGMKANGLEGFTDADCAMQEHRHVITGYTFLIDGGAISWSSKKQEIVTLHCQIKICGHYTCRQGGHLASLMYW